MELLRKFAASSFSACRCQPDVCTAQITRAVPVHQYSPRRHIGNDATGDAYSVPVPGSPLKANGIVRKIEDFDIHSPVASVVTLKDVSARGTLVVEFHDASEGFPWDPLLCPGLDHGSREIGRSARNVRSMTDPMRVHVMGQNGSLFPATLMFSSDYATLHVWYEIDTENLPLKYDKSDALSDDAVVEDGMLSARRDPLEEELLGSSRGYLGRGKLNIAICQICDVLVGAVGTKYATSTPADEDCVTIVFDRGSCISVYFSSEERDPFVQYLENLRQNE